MTGLRLDPEVRFGVFAHPLGRAEVRAVVGLAEAAGFDGIWCGDHVAFTSPILDPLQVLAQAAALSDRLTVGTAVYLLPLRPAAAVAKQAATLDRLSDGRFVFGVGVGGEFPGEFDACGVPVGERGARLSEGIDVLRALWRDEPASHAGRFWRFEGVHAQPPPLSAGGPPLWAGGRSDAALRRIGRKAEGWIAYVTTPERYAAGLETIAAAMRAAGRSVARFATAHLLFVRIDETAGAALDAAAALLSRRYGMDFRRAAERYAALGPPRQVAERIAAFRDAGVRYFLVDPIGTPAERDGQLRRFADEVRPLIT